MKIPALCLPLVLSSAAFGQPQRTVSCRFLTFMGKGEPVTLFASAPDGASVSCTLRHDRPSAAVVCQASNQTITFTSQVGGKPVAKATIPNSAQSVFLVFMPVHAETSEGQASWKIMTIEDSPKNFPDGGTYVANFYSNDIRFVIGEHKGMLRSGTSHGYPIPAKLDEFNMAPTVFELLKDDKWRVANESSLRFLPGVRYMIFAYMDPATSRPKIRTYQDLSGLDAPTAAP